MLIKKKPEYIRHRRLKGLTPVTYKPNTHLPGAILFVGENIAAYNTIKSNLELKSRDILTPICPF